MRNNVLQKLHHRYNNLFFIEIMLLFSLLILFFIADYFVVWQPTLNRYLHAKMLYHQNNTALFKKQTQLIQEKKTIVTLQQWQNQDADFYNTISATSTVNRQLSLLTNLIQHAQFAIVQITKMTPVNHSKTDCALTLTTTGQFINLFSLITTLNHFAIPFTLSELSIAHHQIKMAFILRGCNA